MPILQGLYSYIGLVLWNDQNDKMREIENSFYMFYVYAFIASDIGTNKSTNICILMFLNLHNENHAMVPSQ